MNKFVIFIAMLMLVPTAQAFMLLEVAWTSPPHTVGSAPATDPSGTFPDRPSIAQQTTIHNNILGFDGQVAVLDGAENSFIGFYQSSSFTSGVHRISWLAAMLTSDPSTEVIAQSIDNDVSCSFLRGGNIRVYSGDSPDTIIGTWALGEVYQFEALLNLDSDTYDFYFNGNQIITGQALDSNASISQFGFQRPYGSSEFAVDNIQWEVMSSIPEPGTLSLILIGLPSLCFARKRNKKKNRSQQSVPGYPPQGVGSPEP